MLRGTFQKIFIAYIYILLYRESIYNLGDKTILYIIFHPINGLL